MGAHQAGTNQFQLSKEVLLAHQRSLCKIYVSSRRATAFNWQEKFLELNFMRKPFLWMLKADGLNNLIISQFAWSPGLNETPG